MLIKKGTEVPFIYPSKIFAKIEKIFCSSKSFDMIFGPKTAHLTNINVPF